MAPAPPGAASIPMMGLFKTIAPVEHSAPPPPDLESIYAAGNALAKSGEYDQAIEQYDHVIRLDPNHINALNNRGNAYLAKGAYEEAIADFDKAIALKPASPNLHYSLGHLLWKNLKVSEARAELEAELGEAAEVGYVKKRGAGG